MPSVIEPVYANKNNTQWAWPKIMKGNVGVLLYPYIKIKDILVGGISRSYMLRYT